MSSSSLGALSPHELHILRTSVLADKLYRSHLLLLASLDFRVKFESEVRSASPAPYSRRPNQTQKVDYTGHGELTKRANVIEINHRDSGS